MLLSTNDCKKKGSSNFIWRKYKEKDWSKRRSREKHRKNSCSKEKRNSEKKMGRKFKQKRIASKISMKKCINSTDWDIWTKSRLA